MNNLKNYINTNLTLMMLAVFTITVHAGTELKISPKKQNGSNLCWAACCEMILAAYGKPTTQRTIVNWAVGGQDVRNSLSGGQTTCDKVLMHFDSIETNHVTANPNGYGNLSRSDVTYEIDTCGTPFIAAWCDVVDAPQHGVLIIGYTGYPPDSVREVIFNEPSRGKKAVMTYAEFVRKGNLQKWCQTLRLTSKPNSPIPTGIGPNEAVKIESGTTEITESTHTLTYNAQKYGAHVPETWNWKLYFTHKEGNGEYLAASWTEENSDFESTWVINDFSLPDGYKWNYNYDGMIVGRVEVSVYDDESPPTHDHNLNVYFVPDDLYPGYLLYENKTVSDAQPDVRAHYRIVLNNVEFLPGADINFKAGEQIEMGDNVEIESGSKTDFIVDPSLQNY